MGRLSWAGFLPLPVGLALDDHQRNAKLQLTVLLAPPEAVPDLYLHPEHRRRRSRPALRTEFDV
jgi:hypothetical protein